MRPKRKTFESQQNEAAQMSHELGIVTDHSLTVRVFKKFSHVQVALVSVSHWQ
jgi:hypothetical protein